MQTDSNRYPKCVEVFKCIRWDIDRDVIRDHEFDFSKKFVVDAVSRADKSVFSMGPSHATAHPHRLNENAYPNDNDALNHTGH
jgi:hypothetical protein